MPTAQTKFKKEPVKIDADSLEPPYIVEDREGNPVFLLKYINGGVLRDVPCTKSVFREIESSKLDMVIDQRFVLDFDKAENVVVKISRMTKGDDDPASIFDSDDKASSFKDKFIIAQRITVPNGNFSIRVKPDKVDNFDASSILDDMNKHLNDTIAPGDIIADRWIVHDVRRNGTYVYINSEPLEDIKSDE